MNSSYVVYFMAQKWFSAPYHTNANYVTISININIPFSSSTSLLNRALKSPCSHVKKTLSYNPLTFHYILKIFRSALATITNKFFTSAQKLALNLSLFHKRYFGDTWITTDKNKNSACAFFCVRLVAPTFLQKCRNPVRPMYLLA